MKPKVSNSGFDDSLASNVSLLETFWNRLSFHDLSIDSIKRENRRVIIQLSEYVLILTDVTRFHSDIEDFPTSWLAQKISVNDSLGALAVDAEAGTIQIQFRNLRMLRASDFAILLPPVDS